MRPLPAILIRLLTKMRYWQRNTSDVRICVVRSKASDEKSDVLRCQYLIFVRSRIRMAEPEEVAEAKRAQERRRIHEYTTLCESMYERVRLCLRSEEPPPSPNVSPCTQSEKIITARRTDHDELVN
jgi:hypothetical protein